MEKVMGWGLVSASGFPSVPLLLLPLSPPARGGQDTAAPARLGRIEHPCAACAQETPKGFPGREVPNAPCPYLHQPVLGPQPRSGGWRVGVD